MGREISHIELNSKDLTETKKFYSRLFRWNFENYGDQYMMFVASKTKGVTGGGFQLSKKVPPSSIRIYVSVDSIPKTQQKAVSLGGRIGTRKKAIGGGHGYWGTIRDPHGNVIGLHSSK